MISVIDPRCQRICARALNLVPPNCRRSLEARIELVLSPAAIAPVHLHSLSVSQLMACSAPACRHHGSVDCDEDCRGGEHCLSDGAHLFREIAGRAVEAAKCTFLAERFGVAAPGVALQGWRGGSELLQGAHAASLYPLGDCATSNLSQQRAPPLPTPRSDSFHICPPLAWPPSPQRGGVRNTSVNNVSAGR